MAEITVVPEHATAADAMDVMRALGALRPATFARVGLVILASYRADVLHERRQYARKWRLRARRSGLGVRSFSHAPLPDSLRRAR